MVNDISNTLMNPKEATGILKQFIIEDFERKLPRHSYVQSYFTEELGMSEEEANGRAELAKRMFSHQSLHKPPICEELHEQNSSTLIISDPDSAILTTYKGKHYHYPVEFQLYRHIVKKITENHALKATERIITDEKKETLSLRYTFF